MTYCHQHLVLILPYKVTPGNVTPLRKANSEGVNHIQHGTRLCRFKSLTSYVMWNKLFHFSVLQFPHE